MFDFIKTLNESELIKGQESLKNFSARDIADLTFLCFLTLEILRNENEGVDIADKYLHKVLMFDDVDNFRLSGNDLYTFLFVLFGKNNNSAVKHLKNQDDSLELLKTLRFSYREFKDWVYGEIESSKFLLALEASLNIRNSDLRNLRREVCEWSNLSFKDKVNATVLRVELFKALNGGACDLGSVLITDSINEMAMGGAVSAGAIASVPQPMFSQPISRLPTKSPKKNKKSNKNDK